MSGPPNVELKQTEHALVAARKRAAFYWMLRCSSMLDNSSVDAWPRDFISHLLAKGDDEDATSGAIYILRGVLDRIEPGIPLSENHRQYLVEQIPSIASSYDNDYDVSDDIAALASTINGWA